MCIWMKKDDLRGRSKDILLFLYQTLEYLHYFPEQFDSICKYILPLVMTYDFITASPDLFFQTQIIQLSGL